MGSKAEAQPFWFPQPPSGCMPAEAWRVLLNLPPGSVYAGATVTPFGYGGQTLTFRAC